MLLCDWQIRLLCQGDSPMISPFIAGKVRDYEDKPVLSYGLDTVGYDIRLGNRFAIAQLGMRLDPKDTFEAQYRWFDVADHQPFEVPPNTAVLAHSVEQFIMPFNVMAFAVGKSTLARVNLFTNITPLEPAWRGVLTLELANLGHVPSAVYPGEGIASLRFFSLENPEADYAQRGGKYQDQGYGITLARG